MNRTLHRAASVWLAAAVCACAMPEPPPAAAPPEPPSTSANASALDCRSVPDRTRPQFIIGYGSLMQDESRQRTSPQAGPAQPVEVTGFRRAWIAQGSPVGLSTTFLGVTADRRSRINAVIYRIEPIDMAATDRREASYCRRSVPEADITPLAGAALPLSDSQIWIYVSAPASIATPSARFPIVQSYVDIFVAGCLEQEQRFALEGFARQCLQTTDGWSEHWVNDRQFPRRPFIHQPKAGPIDALLARHLPALFSRIKVE